MKSVLKKNKIRKKNNMSTRSLIGIRTAKGYKHIYCHYDGSPEHHLPILEKCYSDPAKAEELISLGDLSVLAEEIGEKHDFDKGIDKQPNWCLYYGRDCEEENVDTRLTKTIKEAYKRQDDVEYIYVLEGIEWKCYTPDDIKNM